MTTPAEIRLQLEALGSTQEDIAAQLGIAPATLRRYLMDPATPSALTPPAWLPYALTGIAVSRGKRRRRRKPA